MRGRDEKFQAALDALQAGSGRPWLDRVMKKRVIVHLKNSMTIEGVLMEQEEDGVILRAAKLLGDDGKQTTMAGEVWVPRDGVAFAQIDE